MTNCLSRPVCRVRKGFRARKLPQIEKSRMARPRHEHGPWTLTPHALPVVQPFPEAVALIFFKLQILPRHLKIFRESVSPLNQGTWFWTVSFGNGNLNRTHVCESTHCSFLLVSVILLSGFNHSKYTFFMMLFAIYFTMSKLNTQSEMVGRLHLGGYRRGL